MSKVPDENLRAAMHYLLRALCNVYNDYGAGGAWAGAPVPLHVLHPILETTEALLTTGLDETYEKLKKARIANEAEE